ncbi:MAG: BatD family protein [Spirochaetota bacterium]
MNINMNLFKINNMKNLIKIGIISLILVLSLLNIVSAQNNNTQLVQSALGLDGDRNPYLSLNITVEGTSVPNNIDDFRFDEKTPIRIKKPVVRGTGSQTSIINGKKSVKSTASLYFKLIPPDEGTYTVPPLIITIGDKKFKSTGLKLNFIKIGKGKFTAEEIETNDASSIVKFKLTPQKKSAYPQEGIKVRADIYLAQLKGYQASSISLNLSFAEDVGKDSIKPIPPQEDYREMYEFKIENIDKTIKFINTGVEEINGKLYMRFSGWFKVFAKEPGIFTLYSSQINVVYDEGMSIFSDQKKITAYSEAQTLHIKFFPNENKPENFSGAVGKYSINSKIDESTFKVGEPILLEVNISGDGILSNIDKINLTKIKDFRDNFKITKDNSPGEVEGNTVKFKYTIRATNNNISIIPRIPFNYFDVEKEEYNTIYTEEIPINVSHTKVIGEEDVISNNEGNKENDGDRPGITATSGILANYTSSNALTNHQKQPLYYMWILIFPLAFVILYLIIRKKQHLKENKSTMRFIYAKKNIENQLENIEKNIETDEFFEDMAKAVMNYISDKFHRGRGEITVEEAKAILSEANIPEEKQKEIEKNLKTILKNIEMGRFTSLKTNNIDERKKLITLTKDTVNKIESIKNLN